MDSEPGGPRPQRNIVRFEFARAKLTAIGFSASLILVVGLLLVISGVVGKSWQAYRFAVAKRQLEHVLPKMDPLIDALERYHRDKGTYPINLKLLVPDYLNAVPKLPLPPFLPGIEDGYEYSPTRHGSYVLMAAVVGHDDTLYHLSHFAEFISFAGPTEPLPPGPEPYGRVGRWDYYSVYREFID